MEYYLLDVKRTVKVNGVDVAFDYINTYYYPNEAVKEAMVLSLNEEVLHASVHKWFVDEKGEHDHATGNGSILYCYDKKTTIVETRDPHKDMYCITHRPYGFDKEMYLAWQTPMPYAADDGYFWTWEDSFRDILRNSTEEHPFLFNSKAEAIELLKSIKIQQRCSIVKWKG